MDKLTEILEAQKKSHSEMKDSLEGYRKELGDQVVAVGGRVDTVENHIKEFTKKLDEVEEKIRLRPEGLIPGISDEIDENGEVSVIEAMFEKGSRSRELVAEYNNKKAEKGDLTTNFGQHVKAMSTDTDTLGGFVVPAIMLPGYVEKARQRSVVWKEAGITIYDGLQGSPVEIPIETSNPTIYPVGETEAPTLTDVTLGQLSMTPKVLRSLTKLSQRLIRLGPLAEKIVRNAHAKEFAKKIDGILLRGTGTAKQAQGIANTTGIINVEIGTNGGDFTYSVAQDMIIELEDQNTDVGNLKYIGHPRAFHLMKKERILQYSADTAGAYVILPMSDANMRDRLGYDFLKTNVIPKTLTKGTGTALTEVYYGNWENLWLALWEDLFFKVSTETGDATGSAFTQSQLWLQGEMEYDVAVPVPKSFVLVNDAKTT